MGMWRGVIKVARHVVGNLIIGIGDSVLPPEEQHRNQHPMFWPNTDIDERAGLDS